MTDQIYVSKDGKRTPVRAMADDHIINCIRLWRRAMIGVLRALGDTAGARDRETVDMNLSACVASYPKLLREARKRRLNI